MNSVRLQICSMLTPQPAPTGFRALLKVDPGFMLFPDHFPGQPVLPGICLVQAVLLAGETWLGGAALRLETLKSAKFLGIVQPGDEVVIEGSATRHDDGSVRIKADLSSRGKRIAQISMTARQALSAYRQAVAARGDRA